MDRLNKVIIRFGPNFTHSKNFGKLKPSSQTIVINPTYDSSTIDLKFSK